MAPNSRYYRCCQVLLPLVVVGYAAASFITTGVNRGELFPLFRWSLFSHTAAIRDDITLLVRSVNGEAVAPPRFFFDMGETFAAARNKNITVKKMLWEFAGAVRDGDDAKAEVLRRVLEAAFLRDVDVVDYDLVQITYDPLERLHHGIIQKTETIASFHKGDRS